MIVRGQLLSSLFLGRIIYDINIILGRNSELRNWPKVQTLNINYRLTASLK